MLHERSALWFLALNIGNIGDKKGLVWLNSHGIDRLSISNRLTAYPVEANELKCCQEELRHASVICSETVLFACSFQELLDAASDVMSDWLDKLHGAEVTDNKIFDDLPKLYEDKFHQDMAALNVRHFAIL